ncbi:hypothetical protein HBB16_10545 [Pseudonocardia sp. MCCB 268]|nr:hypothetical protein [Pseudonocardia cytotoxica]
MRDKRTPHVESESRARSASCAAPRSPRSWAAHFKMAELELIMPSFVGRIIHTSGDVFRFYLGAETMARHGSRRPLSLTTPSATGRHGPPLATCVDADRVLPSCCSTPATQVTGGRPDRSSWRTSAEACNGSPVTHGLERLPRPGRAGLPDLQL